MKKSIFAIVSVVALFILPSCLKGEMDEYEKWRDVNDAYVRAIDTTEYQKITPDWAPGNSVYMKWFNDRSLTANNLVPLVTSTVSVTYRMKNIEDKDLGSSYTAGGDSLYTNVVNKNIVGFQIALMQMHVGDSVQVIIPYKSGYGSTLTGSVTPYSNLIYNVKLVSIPAYEKP